MRSQVGKYIGPSPAEYGNLNYDLIRKKTPSYSLKSRRKYLDQAIGPGPIAYNPVYNTKKNPPKFSFGVKHSDCAPPARVDLDDEE